MNRLGQGVIASGVRSGGWAVAALSLLLSACGGGDGTTGLAAGNASVASSSGGGGATGTQSLALRALPAIYQTSATQAVNYSPYRAGGPGVETPSVANIQQDLGLLSAAGYTLIRLFGADTVSESVLQVAAANYPSLKFHQGIYLAGIAPTSQATCSNSANDTQVQTGIRLAQTYTNVVAVSVGNETGFFSQYMPINCLAGYITTTKHAVTQPVTADDDYRFYAGLQPNKPDTILPLLDFVSLHTYPLSNQGAWTGSVPTTGTNTQRASALMQGALANAQSTFAAATAYIAAHGGAGLPVIIGETGWKATPTNPYITASTGCAAANAAGSGNPLEGQGTCTNGVIATTTTRAATQDNAHWYFDLINGWSTGGASTAPRIVFHFEAFDESWKGIDDGWGFWDKNRAPRQLLCSLSGVASTVSSCPASGTYPNAAF